MLFLTFFQTADRTRQPTVSPVKFEPINFRTIPKEINGSSYEQFVDKIYYFAKTYYFFDTLIMMCATYKLSLNHKTSVTAMFSKALNFTKDKSKSDYAYSQLELKICIRSQW